jgi:AcrR family transcriptional regulator
LETPVPSPQPNTSCLSGCARRVPAQKRGEQRVEQLLDAAVAEFAASGYDGATMSAIAKRAGAPIGSLYQFFPNKEAIARAVRTRHIEDVERQWPLVDVSASQPFADTFIDLMIEFVRGHPAFLPLQDAPTSTQPIGPRHRLRARIVLVLRSMQPRLDERSADRVAETVMVLNKAMMGQYARAAAPADARWLVEEYRSVLRAMVSRAVADEAPKRRGMRPSPARPSCGGAEDDPRTRVKSVKSVKSVKKISRSSARRVG